MNAADLWGAAVLARASERGRADLDDAATRLTRRVRADRLAAVVRRPVPALGGRSLLELAQAGEYALLRTCVEAWLDLPR